MSKLSTKFKICQTCRYWNGSRNIDGISQLIEAYSEKGKCSNPKGFYNQDMSKQATCREHAPVI